MGKRWLLMVSQSWKKALQCGWSWVCRRRLPPRQPLPALPIFPGGWDPGTVWESPNSLSLSELNPAQNCAVHSQVVSSWGDFLFPEETLTFRQRSRRVVGIRGYLGGSREETSFPVWQLVIPCGCGEPAPRSLIRGVCCAGAVTSQVLAPFAVWVRCAQPSFRTSSRRWKKKSWGMKPIRRRTLTQPWSTMTEPRTWIPPTWLT